MKRLLNILIILFLSSCIVVPKKEMVYSEECGYMVKKMTLSTEDIGYIDVCESEECALVVLTTAAAIGTASLVVSGSITIVSNIIYWIERKANCPA